MSIEETEKGKQMTIADYLAMAPKFEPVVDYNTKLSNFEGPLDLLLYLVNRAQIEIKDIFVSEVTEQFISYINAADDMDMEKESEYLNMAATLLEIKSKSLLPVVDFDEDYYEEDPERELFRQLEEYKLFKEITVKLKDKETTDIFYREPEETVGDVKTVYKDFNMEGLIKALSDVLARNDLDMRIKTERKEIPKDVFTVAEKVQFIRDTLLAKQSCGFRDLFKNTASRSEIITTFQALLELLKQQYVSAEQSETYEDIKITLRADRSEEIGDLSEYN